MYQVTANDIHRYRELARELKRKERDRSNIEAWQSRFAAARYSNAESGAYAYK